MQMSADPNMYLYPVDISQLIPTFPRSEEDLLLPQRDYWLLAGRVLDCLGTSLFLPLFLFLILPLPFFLALTCSLSLSHSPPSPSLSGEKKHLIGPIIEDEFSFEQDQLRVAQFYCNKCTPTYKVKTTQIPVP